MSYVKKQGEKQGDETQQIHKIRIKLSSRNPKALEKVCADLMLRAKEHKIKARGPVRLPTRTLRLTVRKSPCGNGTASSDHYMMNIYKRLIDFYAPQDAVKQITSINMEAGVDVDVTVEQA